MKNYQRVDSVKRPLKIGEKFIVPCMVKRNNHIIISFTPIINLPHSDIENGQSEIHYHTDYRFILTKKTTENGEGFVVIDERDGFKQSKPRVEKGLDGEIEYHLLPVVNEEHDGTANNLFIRNSKLKHKRIQKGKCPHRGYDLSQIKAIDGIIKCPLHGLMFSEKTGKITNECLSQLNEYRQIDQKRKEEIKLFFSKINAIKNGDIISLKEYKSITNLMPPICRIITIPNGKNIDCEIEIIKPNDIPSEFKSRTIFYFKVKS